MKNGAKFLKLEGYELMNPSIAVVSRRTSFPSAPLYCCIACKTTQNCKSVSVNKQQTTCKLYDVSVTAYGSNPVEDSNWDTYTYTSGGC